MHSLNNENLNNELKNYILGDWKHPDERTHTRTLQYSHAMIQAQIQKKYNIELTKWNTNERVLQVRKSKYICKWEKVRGRRDKTGQIGE